MSDYQPPEPALDRTPDLSELTDFLRAKGAEQFQHANNSTLYEHLSATMQILNHWGQSSCVQTAGLFHSIYSTDVYSKQLVPLTRRQEVQAVIGASAERLVYLFCTLSRRAFFQQLQSCDRVPVNGLEITLHCSDKGLRERVSREEVLSLIVLHMANEAEQAQTPSGEPGVWLSRVSQLGSQLSREGGQVPPIFQSCTAVIDAKRETKARISYLTALDIFCKNTTLAETLLSACATFCPWIAEPNIWQSYAALRKRDIDSALLFCARAKDTLTKWGTPWDKRLPYTQWFWLLSFIEQQCRNSNVTTPLPLPDSASLRNFALELRQRVETTPSKVTLTGKASVTDGFQRGEVVILDKQHSDVEQVRLQRYFQSLVYNQEDPGMGFFPALNSKPWHDPYSFTVARALENAYSEISREVLALEYSEFQTESEEIGRVGSWTVFFLYERGRKHFRNCSRCPATTRIIEDYETVRTLAGMAYVSKMTPGTHIAPHHGPTNIRVRCHLGIRIPQGDCGLRVDNEVHRWEQGKCIVFDDYYEHEAWNNTAEPRIVLIVDLWHPDLTAREIAFLRGLHRYAFFHANSLDRYWAANSKARDANPEYD